MWGRAALLGVAMLGTGTVSHVSAGGLLPHPVALLALAVGFVALAARFLLGPASTRRVVALVVLGQGAAHTALSALAGHRGDAGTPEHVHARHRAVPSGGVWHRAEHLTEHLTEHLAEQGPLMLGAHLAGAVALGLVLAVGERALWALVHLAAARVVVMATAGRSAAAALAVLRSAAATPRPRPRVTGFTPVPRLDRPALSRRGPPVLLAI